MLKRLISISCLIWVAGCSVHKLDIQQGNIIEEEQLQQLEPGMSRQQVEFVMGTPLLVDSFHENRWDYVYMLREDNKVHTREHVTLFFDGDTLTRIVVEPDGKQAQDNIK